jgi:hypothetical protein
MRMSSPGTPTLARATNHSQVLLTPEPRIALDQRALRDVPTFWNSRLTIGPRKMRATITMIANEGQEQTVLDEGLAFLVVAVKVNKKSADELHHAFNTSYG